ncbi:uncharacterized protein LOC121107490 isoform X1 [Gallus gallus]|uniref:uncharacterized protein LOC121107490 isoform X1 n=3 Tax=Gallus gallus TaxID=9031 RepID=UPI000739ADD5|nr:uncharacterized protein LOC121107490 isoform X1 [Gallus gallus]XP_040545967.1 uncharacterized protein LOC121107490 isoform X1 [Gallus gallus]
MILRFYDVSTGPTQPWCSTSQEQQPAGSHHPESRSREVTMPRPMAVRCCAVSSQGLAATLSCAAGFALCDAHCGCSGGVGSMVRVWGAMAPARFVLFLLLMAMCFRETCAAPWRAPGAGDELGAPFPDDRLDPDFVPVPLGQPRGPAGESAEQNPASEPEGDAGDVTGGGDPGSALSSGTETPADRMGVPPGRALPGHVFPPALEPSWNPSGPEKGKDEPKRGEYSQGSSRLLKELVKEMEKAARGTDQQSEQDALQEGSHPTLPVSGKGTQAAPTTVMPGMNAGTSTKAAVGRSARRRHIAAMVLFSAVLLSALVLACGAVIWMCQKYVVCKREERAAEQAHPDTN